MSPKRYLSALRLDGVRDELQVAQGSDETITDIASRWGVTNSPKISRL